MKQARSGKFSEKGMKRAEGQHVRALRALEKRIGGGKRKRGGRR